MRDARLRRSIGCTGSFSLNAGRRNWYIPRPYQVAAAGQISIKAATSEMCNGQENDRDSGGTATSVEFCGFFSCELVSDVIVIVAGN